MKSPEDQLTPRAFFDNYVDLVPVGPSRRVNFLPQADTEGAAASVLRRWGRTLILVVFPTVLTAIYFLIFAADRYVSETRFAVRRASGGAGLLSELLPVSAGPQRATDEAYALEAFVMSRDAMSALVAKDDLDQMFARSGLDFFWSFPSLLGSGGSDAKFEHYKRFVSVANDTTTGVTSIRVEAFRPEDAQRLTEALLTSAESMINRLNDRAEADALAAAEAQAGELKLRMEAAQNALMGFRTREELVDPARMSLSVLQIITLLTVQLVESQATLDELEKSSPQSPQIGAMRRRIDAIERQIATERQKLGGGDDALANVIAEYESLVLEREFAQRAYSAALAAVEATKLENRKQRVYIERIVSAQISDSASYPLRLLWIAVVFLVGVALLRVFSLTRRPA